MHVEFSDKKLEAFFSYESVKTKWPNHITKGACKRLTFLSSATSVDDLKNQRGLRFKKLSGDKQGLYSIRINDRWRMVLALDELAEPLKVVIHSIEDYH